jgi:antitoxin YefM
MKAKSLTEFRKHLAETIDQVNADCEPVLITRDRGKPTAVLISLDDYASLEETRYLLASPRNAERLMAAIAEADAGRAVERDLIE